MKNIHPYHPIDLSDISLIWRESAGQAYPFLSADFIRSEENRIAEDYLPQCETWVWKEEGHCLAFISLMGHEIGGLFVHPDCQNQGLGKALIRLVSQNSPSLMVDVFAKNQRAIRFYQKMGFSISRQKLHEETGEILIQMTWINPKFDLISDYPDRR